MSDDVFPHKTEPELLFLSSYCQSGMVSHVFHVLSYLILPRALQSRNYYYLHFSDGKTEALRDCLTCPGFTPI